jgi:hypothetical protein
MAKANPSSMSAQFEDADQIDLSDFTTHVDDTYQALRAFNFMMENIHEYICGGISPTIGYGMSHLLRRQLDDLQEINKIVFSLSDRVKKAESALSKRKQGLPDTFVILTEYDPKADPAPPTKTRPFARFQP